MQKTTLLLFALISLLAIPTTAHARYQGGSMNLYEYVGGRPASFTDPTGWEAEDAAPALPQTWESMEPLQGTRKMDYRVAIHDLFIAHDWHFFPRWMRKHFDGVLVSDKKAGTVTDIINHIRDTAGHCGCIEHLSILSHGINSGGFRFGVDRNGDGNIQGVAAGVPREAVEQDYVDSARGRARIFGNIIRNAMCERCEINIMTCTSRVALLNGSFVQDLAAATGCTVRQTIGSHRSRTEDTWFGGETTDWIAQHGILEAYFDEDGEVQTQIVDGSGGVLEGPSETGVTGTGQWHD